jgi:hypothetical protein
LLNRFSVEWNNEKETRPSSIDGGKDILFRVSGALLDFRLGVQGKMSEPFLQDVDTAIRQAKKLNGHQLFIDGGSSFMAFWQSGDSLFAQLRQMGAEVESFVFAEQTATGAVNGVPATFTYLDTQPKALKES